MVSPLPTPNDLAAARDALRAWATRNELGADLPVDLIVMFFRNAVEQDGWELRLQWRAANHCLVGAWHQYGELKCSGIAGANLEEVRILACAKLEGEIAGTSYPKSV